MEKNFNFLLILLCIYQVYAQYLDKAFYLKAKTNDIATDVGATVELSCLADSCIKCNVLWFKVPRYEDIERWNYNEFIARQVYSDQDMRYSMIYSNDVDHKKYTLQIKDIQESDDGLYSCVLFFRHYITLPLVHDQIELTVNSVFRSPYILKNSTKSVMTVMENGTVNLECFASGNPKPKVSWRRSNFKLLNTGKPIYEGNVLRFPSIQYGDRGTYYCIAENGYISSVRHTIHIDMHFAPKITITNYYVSQALNYNQDMDCHVEAFPQPTIRWARWDNDLNRLINLWSESTNIYSIENVEISKDTIDTRLHLKAIERHHFGHFACIATNIYGSAQGVLVLLEEKDPIKICYPVCEITKKPTQNITAEDELKKKILNSGYINID